MKTRFFDFLNEKKREDMDKTDKQHEIQKLVKKVDSNFSVVFSKDDFQVSLDGKNYTINRDIDFKLLRKTLNRFLHLERELNASKMFDSLNKTSTVEKSRIRVTYKF
jgi:spore coat polysaccharide biosynthesis protein SpsF (cytidylyltransferase family)